MRGELGASTEKKNKAFDKLVSMNFKKTGFVKGNGETAKRKKFAKEM